jgi:4-hydroxy-2-oxoglutarate aldolase
MRLEGVFSPVVTPFGADGGIDLKGFAANIRDHIAHGVSGIVVTGSTGEAALLDEEERLALIETARRETSSDRTLLIGIGAESTRATIARARAAAERGADGVLVVAPHYYGDQMVPEALLSHYEQVADASPLPVLIYTIPKYMHFAVPPEVVATLAKHENIVGMKDSAGDAELFEKYLASKSDSFRVLTGSGTLWHKALMLGADGGILAVSTFAPALTFDVLSLHKQGDHAAAERVQAALTPLNATIVARMGVPGVKAALDAVGLHGGAPRSPLRPLAAPARAMLSELLRTAELAPAT